MDTPYVKAGQQLYIMNATILHAFRSEWPSITNYYHSAPAQLQLAHLKHGEQGLRVLVQQDVLTPALALGLHRGVPPRLAGRGARLAVTLDLDVAGAWDAAWGGGGPGEVRGAQLRKGEGGPGGHTLLLAVTH